MSDVSPASELKCTLGNAEEYTPQFQVRAHKIAVATGCKLICHIHWVPQEPPYVLGVSTGPILSRLTLQVLLDIGTSLLNIQCCLQLPEGIT
jgi:hypothetical protein